MKKYKFYLTVPSIIAIGAILRILGAATKSFRFEEHALWDITASGNWMGFFKSFHEYVGHGWNPLNPFFCRLARGIGTGEAVIRLPAVFFGIFSIYALYRLGKSIFNESTGIIAAMLLAFSPMAIAWTQDARYFSLAHFLCICSAFFLLEALDGKKRAWAGVVLVHGALLMSTYQGWTIIVLEGLFLFLPVILYGSRSTDNRQPLQPFIYFLVSLFISFILLSMWFYYEIYNDFRIHHTIVDNLAVTGSYRSFLDWGGGDLAGFLFCIFFFLLGMLGGDVKPDGKTSGRKMKSRGALLPVALAGVPVALALAGIYRRDQIFFALPFFLLIVAHGMTRAPAIIHDKSRYRRFILTAILGGYLLLQIVPVYNLQTNKTLSFIPKPDWKNASAYLYSQIIKRKQTILLENEHDMERFRRYTSIAAKKDRNKETKNLPRPVLGYLEENILQTLAKDEYREGSIIQSPDRGGLSALMADPLFSSYFTLDTSFDGLRIYRYRLPLIVMDDTHSRHNRTYSSMTITGSEDFHRQVLFLKPGSYLVAIQSMDNVPGQFSVTIDGGESINVSTDSHGLGSFQIEAERGVRHLVFRLRKPDKLRLMWFGVHRLQKDRIAFQAEDFQYSIPEKTNWVRKQQIGHRKTVGLFINSSIGYYFALDKSGRFGLTLEGYNNTYGPIEVAVELDDRRIGVFSFDKRDRSWSSQYMPLTIPAGVHHIAFSFINDLRDKDGDRNAFLDRFELNRIQGK